MNGGTLVAFLLVAAAIGLGSVLLTASETHRTVFSCGDAKLTIEGDQPGLNEATLKRACAEAIR